MRKFQILLFVLISQLIFCQNVLLSKVDKMNDNTDKFLILLPEKMEQAEYLGEIEVQGFSNDDAAVFSAVYKKAKEIGANSFSLKPFETVDGLPSKFDAGHYRLNLYYISKENLPKKYGTIYIFASSDKDQKISINRKDYLLSPRSYLSIPVTAGEIYTVSTKKLLGSTLKFQVKDQKSSYYFQASSSKIKADDSGAGGINLKSGDLVGIEPSYGDFLRTVFSQK
ncbi:molecular chaperone GroES [Chryseobacterium sp. Leaf404]|uniref:hypothetical protein n=1 Tax=unclassified Chryseobacterium TaxID=2593645 RepID=UPI0006FA2F18|nr:MULTISPECIES: hypothetical protein [unclassified Chryseobacterium]KQT21957.1 molecular chaperone GroES [Chryseobacterium sp. Leaf404]